MGYLGEEIRKLGFGLMRLPQKDGAIDVEQVKEMVDLFMQAGFTYFDTAWAYAGSEDAIRQALVERYPRESYQLATKNAAWIECKTKEEAYEQFDISLTQTGAGYFDFYLLHNLGEARTHYFDEFGMWDWVLEKKKAGLIRHVGFSFHSTPEELEILLKAHPEMEFVQLQINYADWENPVVQSRACYEVARKYGKPVIIMEPLRGGKLAEASGELAAAMQTMRPKETIPGWAFRFLQSIPGVTMVLSGMSTMEQLRANIDTYGTDAPLSGEEFDALIRHVDAELRKGGLPCTACHYCTGHCPQKLPIPELIALYNEHKATGGGFIAPMAVGSMSEEKRPANCIGCGSCEQVCPQQIKISQMMSEFSAMIGM